MTYEEAIQELWKEWKIFKNELYAVCPFLRRIFEKQ